MTDHWNAVTARVDTVSWRPWLLRGAAVFVAGVAGAAGAGALAQGLLGEATEWGPLLVAAGVAAVCTVLPAWWGLLRDGRHGPAWGAVAGACGPVGITAFVTAVTLVAVDQPAAATFYQAALFYLIQVPLTLALAAAGALLATHPETRSPRS